MGLFDEKITYLYTCHKCDISFEFSGLFSEHAEIENCKECGEKLKFTATDYNTHATIDIQKPKTLGSLGEANSKKREKEGQSIEHPHKTYDREILKNPKRYIETGKK